MLTRRLRVGERVKLRVDFPSIPAGTLGTVQTVYHSTPDVYEVVFDTGQAPRLMIGSELEQVTEDRLSERTN